MTTEPITGESVGAGAPNVALRATQRRLARAGFIGIVGAAASALLGWGRVKGLALLLGPSGVGLYGQAWAFVLLVASFASLGIGVGTTSLVAFHRERGERVELASVTRSSLVLPGIASLVVAVVTAGGATVLSPLVLGGHRPWLIVLAAFSIPFAAMQLPLQHVLQGFEDVVGQNVIYVLYGGIFTATVLIGAYVGGVYGAVVGLLAGNAVLAVLYLVRTRRLHALAGAPLRLARKRAVPSRALLGVGAASLAVTAAYGVADLGVRTVLLHTHGSQVAGYWFALLTISVQFIGMLVGAMSYFTAPLASRARGGSDPEATQRLLDDSLRLALAVVVPILVLLVALRHVVVVILFSSAFEPIAHMLPLQLAGDAARTVCWTLGVALIPLGLTRAWLVTGIGTSVVLAAAGSLLAERWGVNGAAGAWALTWTVTAIATAVVLIRRRFWRPSRQVTGGLLVSAGALGLATLLPGAVGVAVAVVATGLLLVAMSQRAERQDVVRALRRRRLR